MAAYASAGFDKPAHEPPQNYEEPRQAAYEAPVEHKPATATTGYEQPAAPVAPVRQEQQPAQGYEQPVEQPRHHKPPRPAQPKYEEIMSMLPGAGGYDQPAATEAPVHQQPHSQQGYEQPVHQEQQAYEAPVQQQSQQQGGYDAPVHHQEEQQGYDAPGQAASEFMHIRMEEPYAAPVMTPQAGHGHQGHHHQQPQHPHQIRGYDAYPEPPVMPIMMGY